MATERERDLFASSVLAAVGREAARLPKSKVTGFLAMRGCSYDQSLLVVGRAVNGWLDGIPPAELASISTVRKYSKKVHEKSVAGNGGCPMLWVTDHWSNPNRNYNTNSSAFWRTIRGVVAQLSIADVELQNWPSYLVWSNLYKVSPEDGGNPSDPLCEVQLPGCTELFNLELMTYMPSRLLLLTGTAWAAGFLGMFDGVLQKRSKFRYVEQFGTVRHNGTHQLQCVVAVHPQGKPEAQWINEVVEAYK